jgi:hypothetical protein
MNKGLIATSVGVGIAGIAAGTAVYALSNEKTRKRVGQTISNLVKEGRSALEGGKGVVEKGQASVKAFASQQAAKKPGKLAKK